MSRLAWNDVPSHLRDAVAGMLGSPVVAADSQAGGFSPGSADRVLCADGRRAFVKTATAHVNPRVVPIHRSEAAVAAVLPDGVPSPALIGVADGGDWIALAFEEIDGTPPQTPWSEPDLRATLDVLAATAQVALDASARAVILPADDAVAEIADGWSQILADARHPVDDANPDVAWALAHAQEWAAEAERVRTDAAGDALLHFDARSDNVLVRADGSAVLVDWPWARRGAPWFDALTLLVDARWHDPDLDIDRFLDHDAFAAMDAAAADRMIVAFAGFMLDRGRQPDQPGIPTLREFQRQQGAVASRIARERRG